MLEIKVTERTAEVREKSKDIQAMLSNIPQGLFTVQDNGNIHPEYSRFLETIFETNNIAGRNVNEFLFESANVGSDALDSAKAALFTIIGEDEINFDFNKYLLLNEYDIEIDHKKKYLSLDWSPITAGNIVSKLMVSVRDVTQLRQMESAAREQKRQLDIVSQLLNLSAEKYLGFEESAIRYVQENRKAIQSCSTNDNDIVSLLFRNMHTIKGNCRTFGFTCLSNVVHEAESFYSALKLSPEAEWDSVKLLSDLEVVEKVLAEYAHVFRAVLGRSDSSQEDRRGGFWLSHDIVNQIKHFVEKRKVNDFESYMSRLNAITIEQNLTDIIASLASIAAQLDKSNPIVKISATKIFIKYSAQELMRNVFSHILRNCVDHGLESRDERIAAGKSECGSISIDAQVHEDTLKISVQDDGRGLNIRNLFSKGVQLGKWNENDNIDILEVAQLIFYSGVSTKDVVSDISGRGVGMDAVKQFLEEQGGGVSLELHREPGASLEFVPFELIVILPSHLFFEAEVANIE